MGRRPGGSDGAGGGGDGPAGAAPALADLAEYGRGDYDPTTGLYEWYDLPLGHPARPAGPDEEPGPAGPSWEAVLGEWEALEADLHELYGIDLTPALLRRRSSRWLRIRIGGVLSTNTRTARRLGLTAPPAPHPYSSRR